MSDLWKRLRSALFDPYGKQDAAEITSLSAENERLRALLSEVASDLAAELHERYHRTLQYPDQKRRYERDMDSVYRARAALQEQDDG